MPIYDYFTKHLFILYDIIIRPFYLSFLYLYLFVLGFNRIEKPFLKIVHLFSVTFVYF